MSKTCPPFDFHIEHQTAPAWPSEAVLHDECERHTRKLWRTACGCMRYGAWTTRPKATILTASGLSMQTNVARLFVAMSADQPIRGTDYACHRCDDPLCAHPDHLYVGDHRKNVLDGLYPGRRIRVRKAMRFFDDWLLEIPEPVPVLEPRPRLIAASHYPASLGTALPVSMTA